jgi:hypothetical protein
MSYKNLQYVAVFTLIFLSVFWQYTGQGMFMDGLIYASISRNLAINIGSFFEPIYVDSFESNLSLTYFIQSFFFRVFGDYFWVEKLHNAVFLVLNIVLLHNIYKIKHKSSPIPILFWWLSPSIPWIFTNNLMEITVSFFFLLSLFFYLKHKENHQKTYYIFFVLTTIFASYSKAFVGFFPLVFPFVHFFIYRKISFQKLLIEYLVLLSCIGFVFGLLFCYDPALIQWKKIIAYQLHSNDLVSNSFWLSKLIFIKEILVNFWPQLFILCLLFVIKRRKKLDIAVHKDVSFFFLLFLLAIIPFSIFKKFFGFYLSIAAPFLALGVASYFSNFEIIFEKFLVHNSIKKHIYILLILLNIVGFVVFIIHFGNINRDRHLIEDSQFIASEIAQRKSLKRISYINLSQDFAFNYYEQAYLARAIPQEIRMYTADSIQNFKGFYISKNSLSPNAIWSPHGYYYLNKAQKLKINY